MPSTVVRKPARRGTRRALVPEIQLVVSASADGTPLHTRIYRQLREHILRGALPPGARVPSARALAADLRVSRNTAESALAQLVAEGFIERRVGSGTVVADSLTESAPFLSRPRTQRASDKRPESPSRPIRHSARGQLITRLGSAEIAGDEPIGPNTTNVQHFPWRRWARLTSRLARRSDASYLGPSDSQGLRLLRQQIAEYASLARGLRCTADQVVVMNSTQQAIDLASRLLLDAGETAFVEDPGYPSARAALLAAGASVCPLPVDADGLRLDDVGPAPGRETLRLVYVTPSHQFPLGVTMTLARRLALLRWAAAYGTWIIEDDYDSELRYDGRPIAALHCLDRAARVVYVGTFNKVLFPGLRLAYVIAPDALVASFAAARRLADGFSSALSQAVLAEFMESGHFAAYLRQARQHYASCRATLVESIAEHWGDVVRLGPSSTGLHLVAHLKSSVDDRALADAARSGGHALGVAPLSRYFYGATQERGLLLSFGAATPAAVRTAVRALAPLVRRACGVRKVAP